MCYIRDRYFVAQLIEVNSNHLQKISKEPLNISVWAEIVNIQGLTELEVDFRRFNGEFQGNLFAELISLTLRGDRSNAILSILECESSLRNIRIIGPVQI